jgi:uncharacterized phage protein (TIGR01671 family)
MEIDNSGLIISHKYPHSVIINRSTGYCDQDDKEIFEGDIVETCIYDSNERNGKWKAIVKWNESCAQWCLGNLQECDQFGELERYVDTLNYRAKYPCKVIGNVYQNYRLAKRL